MENKNIHESTCTGVAVLYKTKLQLYGSGNLIMGYFLVVMAVMMMDTKSGFAFDLNCFCALKRKLSTSE